MNDLTGQITIPQGEANVSVSIQPIFDSGTESDTTVIITLADATYMAGTPNTATMTIFNINPPSDKNVWIGITDGNASDASNWSQGRVPNATDNILLDLFSTSDIIWDVDGVNGLSDTVASWTQTSNYTGTVTFPITYDTYSTTFTNFTVTGDVDIQGGTWTHTSHGSTSSQKYHLQVKAEGNFTLGAGGSINVDSQGPWTEGASAKCAGHGGNALYGSNTYPAFDNLMFPTLGGKGSQSGTDSNNKKSSGGGAIWLIVGQNASIDGTLSADGQISYSAGGAGGSVLIEALNILGTGNISAAGNTGTKSDGCGSSGAGGRVALLAEGEMSFPTENVVIKGIRDKSNGKGGAGTFFAKSASLPGMIIVRNNDNINNDATTPIPTTTDTGDWDHVKKITITAEDAAHLEMTRNLSVASISLDSNSTLELSGYDVTAKTMTVDSTEIPIGQYTADEFANEFGSGYVTDSESTGHIIITGDSGGTVIMIN